MQYFHYLLVSNQHKWSVYSCWLVSSIARALSRYRRSHGSNSRTAYTFHLFRLNFRYCFKNVLNCDNHLHLLICSSNTWHSYVYSGLVYHVDNQYLHFYFSALFSYNLMRNLLQYFYQVPHEGSQYIAVLLATPHNCCSQTLLTAAILNNSSIFARVALFPTK